MSEILSRTVFETCLADQTEAPWAEEVRMLLAHDAALRAALAAAKRERDAMLAALLWCDQILGLMMTTEDDAEQPVPGDEMASSVKWRLNRVRERLHERGLDLASETRWAKEYLDRAEAAESERDSLRSRLAEMEHLGPGAARSAG